MSAGEQEKSKRLIESMQAILAKQYPMTVRQVYYRLVAIAVIKNGIAGYRAVVRLLGIARDDGRIEWDWIVDRTRPEYAPSMWDDPDEFMQGVAKWYRKNFWLLQPNHVEIWAEKDTVIGTIQEITDELGVLVRVGRGYQSKTKKHEIYEFFKTITKPIVVLYLGDHDSSGRDIGRDVAEQVRDFGCRFRFKRIAIEPADIKKFNLPPDFAKTTDSRTKQFLEKYDDKCVELEALTVEELRRRVDSEVKALIEPEAWKKAERIQEAELEQIKRFMSKWKRSK
jgi:hypothetical protein